MLKNFLVFLLAVVALFATVTLSYIFWQSQHNDDISCTTSITTHREKGTLHVTSSYVFNNKKGFLSMNGYLEEDPSHVLNRKILFEYQRDKETYVLHSLHNIKYPEDTVSDEWMAGFFPEFYIYEGRDIHYKMIKQFNNNYLFILGTLPTFSCKYVSTVAKEI